MVELPQGQIIGEIFNYFRLENNTMQSRQIANRLQGLV